MNESPICLLVLTQNTEHLIIKYAGCKCRNNKYSTNRVMVTFSLTVIYTQNPSFFVKLPICLESANYVTTCA